MGSTIPYSPAICHALGNLSAGILYRQLCYYYGSLPLDDEGFFSKSAARIQVDTAITAQQQRTSRALLSRTCVNGLPLIELKVKANAYGKKPTVHYKVLVNPDEFLSSANCG